VSAPGEARRRTGARLRRGWRAGTRAAGSRWGRFLEWFDALQLSENTILLGFAVVIGVAGAAGVIGFYSLIDLAFTAFYRWTGSVLGRDVLAVYRPVITAAGITLAWAVVRALRRPDEGASVAAVQLAVARRQGEIETRPALGRTVASAVTIGAGGSAGSEGPVAVLGATAGSFLGRVFRFDASRVKVLVAAGAAAGISASFNAPLAGAFFALEEVLGSFAVGAFSPVVVASVVAAVVSRSVFGDHPAFPVPVEYGYALRREVILFYPLLGVLAGLVSVVFIRTVFGVDGAVKRLRLPPVLLPVLGGAAVGLLVWASGGILVGYGHLAVRLEVFGRMEWTLLALLVAGKILATALTLGCGGSGGVFTPSLYVGAATGGAFGVGLAALFPELGLHPEAYALVGMGAVVAAATGAPITAILMVFEMTNDYAIVLPLMLASVVSVVVARRWERDSLYSGWLRRRGEHLEHGADRDVLARLCVADAFEPNPQVIGESATVDQLLEHLGRGEQTEFPVVDGELRLVGVITLAELGRVARDSPALAPVLLAADLANPTESVAPGDSLLEAIRRMGVRGIGALPVVDPSTGKLLGMLGRAHVLALYQRTLAGESVRGR
jgi:CIC family chloride channel protein